MAREASAIMRNFVRMAVFLSINHACVVTLLALSVGLLGAQAGSFQSGTLFFAYAAIALLFSSPLVEALGARRALVIATCLYSFYVATFPMALLVPGPQDYTGMPSGNSATSPVIQSSSGNSTSNSTNSSVAQIAVAVVGGLVGGVGGGFIWAAQGVYFTLSAKLYAAERGIALEQATMTLASIFAAIYLIIEVLTKLLPLALLPLAHRKIVLWDGRTLQEKHLIVVATYTVLAILAVVGMLSITDLRDVKPAEQADGLKETVLSPATEPVEQGELVKAKPRAGGLKQPLLPSATATPPRSRADYSRLLAAVALWRDEPVVLLLNPIQMTFGFCAGMITTNVTGVALKNMFGEAEWVLWGAMFVSLPALVAAVLQYPFKLIADRAGKLPLMLVGLSGFVGVSGIVYFLTTDELQSWTVLVQIVLLQGLGRACYEGTNKALYADFFPTKAAAAFSNIVIANGVSSALLFFMNGAVSNTKTIPLLTLCSAVSTVALYLVAELTHRRRIRKTDVARAPRLTAT